MHQSPGEIKRREASWTLTNKLDAFAGPGEIKRREVSWTLTNKLDAFAGPGEIKRREASWTFTNKLDAFVGPGKIKRREVVLNPQVSPEEIKSREVELGLKVGLLSLQLFPNGGATDIVFVTPLGQQLRGAVVAAQCRTDTTVTFCGSGGGPRQPWSSGLAPVSRFHSSVPPFPTRPRP